MEVCIKCGQNVSAGFLKDGVCVLCEATRQDAVEMLRAKILELELELKKQKTAAEKGEKLLKVMWGDNFNTDSLH